MDQDIRSATRRLLQLLLADPVVPPVVRIVMGITSPILGVPPIRWASAALRLVATPCDVAGFPVVGAPLVWSIGGTAPFATVTVDPADARVATLRVPAGKSGPFSVAVQSGGTVGTLALIAAADGSVTKDNE